MVPKFRIEYHLYQFRAKAGLTDRGLAELSGVSKTGVHNRHLSIFVRYTGQMWKQQVKKKITAYLLYKIVNNMTMGKDGTYI